MLPMGHSLSDGFHEGPRAHGDAFGPLWLPSHGILSNGGLSYGEGWGRRAAAVRNLILFAVGQALEDGDQVSRIVFDPQCGLTSLSFNLMGSRCRLDTR
jgi:hypothetical protein